MMYCCSICGEDHETESCILLTSIQIINDTFTLSRARLTLPQDLLVNDRVDGSTAVIAKSTLKAGVRFGPFKAKTSSTLSPNIDFPLKLFNVEAVWDGDHIVYTDVYLETDDEDNCNWMCLVSAASSVDEQNMFCFQMRRELYYLVIKDIDVGDELKVWYAPYYAKQMCSTTLDPSWNLKKLSMARPSSPVIVNHNDGINGAATDTYEPSNDHLENFIPSNTAERSVNINSNNKNNKSKRRKIDSKRKEITGVKNVAQPMLLLCETTSKTDVIGNGHLYSVNWDNNLSNNDSSNSKNLLLSMGNNFSPLLLGAKQLRDEWNCKICNHTESNVALYAQHLMCHYKPNKSNSNNKKSNLSTTDTCQTCICKKVFTNIKDFEDHKKICVEQNKLNLSTSDTLGFINNINKNCNEIKSVSLSGNLHYETNCNNNNNNNDKILEYNEIHFDSTEQQDQPKLPVSDSCVSVGNVSNERNKITHFECFNFDDDLAGIDIEFGTTNHNNSISMTESRKTKGGKKTETMNISEADELHTSMNLIENMPPILDLTDEIVFQSIKHFPNSLDDEEKTVINKKIILTVNKPDNCKEHSTGVINMVSNVVNDKNNDVEHDATTLMDQIDLLVLEQQMTLSGNDDNNIETNDKLEKCSSVDVTDEDKNRLVDNLLSNVVTTGNDDDPTDVCDNMAGNNDDNITNKQQQQAESGMLNMNELSVSSCLVDEIDCNKSDSITSYKNATNDKVLLKQFQCDICRKKFTKSLYLYRHLRRHTGEFTCLFCMAVFARKETLLSHTCSADQNISSLLKKNKHLCNRCGQVFTNKLQLKIHQDEQCSIEPPDNDIKIDCPNCGKSFSSAAALQLHSNICMNTDKVVCQARFLCDKCGIISKSKRSFNLHSAVHGEPQFCCPVCQKKFYRKDILQTHIMTHQLIPSDACYECPVCYKKFKMKKNLNVHIKMHTGFKRFQCIHCSMSFFQKGNLKKHLKTHKQQETILTDSDGGGVSAINNGSVIYKCSICGHTFNKDQQLRLHLKKVHVNSGNYACSFCDAVLKHRTSLLRHINRKHNSSKNNANLTTEKTVSDNKNCNNDYSDSNGKGGDISSDVLPAVQETQININTTENTAITSTNTATMTTAAGSLMTYILEDGTIIQSVPDTVATSNTIIDNVNDCNNDKTNDYLYYILTPSSAISSSISNSNNDSNIPSVQ
ncbi:uncharacterized protein LOC142326459 isoform X2 [Lycorma delicatula]|uniref:uncharacterized protein LOC142326459 isoform X2 n=1 Tax=Lycorma delicatula TaxID=130591 RepID=UPI003F51055A